MQQLPVPAAQRCTLREALGLFLSQDIAAERDYPPFDRITHDGVALNSRIVAQDKRHFPVEAYAAAGAPRVKLRQPEYCIEVATGAPLPEGCDTVLPYESLDMEEGMARLKQDASAQPGQSLHSRASDAHKGQVLLKAGTRIGIHEINILAANGVARAPVYATPSVGILATGDELVGLDAPVAAHQIRCSNNITLQAALEANHFRHADIAFAPDDPGQIEQRIRSWLEDKECIIITGGVSRGTYDYVPAVLEAYGVSMQLHHVAQRPGKPLWFGLSATGKPVFGLPGNPVSCLVCLTRYVLPALRLMSGGTPPPAQSLQLGKAIVPHPTLTLFLPVHAGQEPGVAIPISTKGSGDFTRLLGSAGFIEILAGEATVTAGTPAPFYPWVTP